MRSQRCGGTPPPASRSAGPRTGCAATSPPVTSRARPPAARRSRRARPRRAYPANARARPRTRRGTRRLSAYSPAAVGRREPSQRHKSCSPTRPARMDDTHRRRRHARPTRMCTATSSALHRIRRRRRAAGHRIDALAAIAALPSRQPTQCSPCSRTASSPGVTGRELPRGPRSAAAICSPGTCPTWPGIRTLTGCSASSARSLTTTPSPGRSARSARGTDRG